MASSSSSDTDPALQLPSYEQVVADGTVAVAGASYSDSFAEGNSGSMYLGISDSNGLLYGFYPAGGSPAATGSGTDSISFQGSYADVEAILNSLTYVATASGGTDEIRYDIWNQAGAETTGEVPVTIGGTVTAPSSPSPGTSNSGTPVLTEPASETVVPGATLAIGGSYSDSLAAGNSGAMYLSITDSSGTLRATNLAGVAVAGSGSNAITLNANYANVNAVLESLTYTGGSATGSDSIHFDLWNQGGVETTDTVPVTIAAGGSPNPAPISESWTGAVSSDWNTAGNWSGGVVPTSGDTVTIAGGTANLATLSNAVLSGETIVLASGTLDFDNVTLGSQLSGNGTVQVGGTLTIGSGTTADVSQLSLTGTNDAIINNGLLSSPGGTIDLLSGGDSSDTSRLVNNGSISATNVIITSAQYPGIPSPFATNLPLWAVQNAGTIGIANGGTFALDGTVSGGEIALAGSATVELEQQMALSNGATVSGIGPGDLINLVYEYGSSLGYANGTLDVLSASGVPIEAIGIGGSVALGNFQLEETSGSNGNTAITYDPTNPVVVVPASATVAQGATLALNDVAISPQYPSDSYDDVDIDAGTGTLYLSGASGSGTHALVLGAATAQQLNAELANLTYVPAAGATSDAVTVTAFPPAPVEISRTIPISITGGGPALQEPSNETVASGGSVAVAGSYSDSFGAGNAGQLYLGISDSTGTLTATNGAGQAVAGSGSHSIAVQADYVDVNAILASLHYTAGASSGSDTISFDVWNQAGVETTGATAVTIDPAPTMTLADLTTGSTTSSALITPGGSGGSAGTTALTDTVSHPIGVPFSVG